MATPTGIDTRSWTMGYYPMPARPEPDDEQIVADLRLFNQYRAADRIAALVAENAALRADLNRYARAAIAETRTDSVGE